MLRRVCWREVEAEVASSRSNTLSMGPEDRNDDDETTRVEPSWSSEQDRYGRAVIRGSCKERFTGIRRVKKGGGRRI